MPLTRALIALSASQYTSPILKTGQKLIGFMPTCLVNIVLHELLPSRRNCILDLW